MQPSEFGESSRPTHEILRESEERFRLLVEGVTAEFEATFPVLGKWVAGRAYPSREGLSVYFQDVTERKRAEESLRRVTEAERKRIARDLHDGVLQDLSYTTAAIGMMVLQAKDAKLRKQLQAAVDAVRRGAQGLREVVNDLRLEDEEDRPLPKLVEALVRRSRSMARGAR
jgi:signal transduction histidine kinase